MDFIDFTKDKNVDVRFIEFMPFSGNRWEPEKGISLAEVLQLAEGKYADKLTRIEDAPNDTAKNYRISGYQGKFGVISSVTNPFCDTCNRIRLTSNGRIKNCLFSNDETDLLTPLREGNDIVPLIHQAIQSKKKVRAGMDTFEQFSNPSLNEDNRSMISIGGKLVS